MTYHDSVTGRPDKALEKLLGEGEEDNSEYLDKIKKIMLNIIKNELTARQNEIIMLYYFRGLDTVQIADRLNVTPQAVSAVLRRARQKLFRFLRYYLK